MDRKGTATGQRHRPKIVWLHQRILVDSLLWPQHRKGGLAAFERRLYSEDMNTDNERQKRSTPRRGLRGLLVIFFVSEICACIAAPAGKPKSTIDFNRDIRPIFSDNCYTCHGPDSGKRKAGLRLDQQEGAIAELKSGNRAIVPGDLSKSALVARITTNDEDDR